MINELPSTTSFVTEDKEQPSFGLAKIPLPALPMDEYQIFGMIEKAKHT